MAGLRSAADDPPPDHTRGSLPLGFGGEYVELGMRGFLGAMPVVVWLVISAVPFEETIAASQVSGAMSAVVASTLGFAALVLPWLVPCLVLRARQPRGARIEWDERTVVEWDGPWRRTEIPWARLELRHATWSSMNRGRTYTHHAVQLVDPATGAAINVWTSEPVDAPTLRRRLSTDDVGGLLAAAEQRGIPVARVPDWSLVKDPERPPRPGLRQIGRLGYPLAVAAPLAVIFSQGAALAEAVVRAGCVLLTVSSTVVSVRHFE